MEERINKQNIFVAFNIEAQKQSHGSQQKVVNRKNKKKMTVDPSLAKSSYAQQECIFSDIPLLQKCKSTQEDCFKNVTKEQIRSTIYFYLKKIIDSHQLLEQQIKHFDFPGLTKSLYIENPILKNKDSMCHSFTLNNSFLRSTLGKPLKNIKTMSKSISIQEYCCGKKMIEINAFQNQSQTQNQQFQRKNLIIYECQSQKYTEQVIIQKVKKQQIQNTSIMLESFESLNQKQKNLQTSILGQKIQNEKKKNHKSQDQNFSQINISIESQSLFSLGKSQYSNESSKFFLLLNDPRFQFTLQFIGDVFDEPDPFLMNLSLCLMMKFMHYSQIQLTKKNICPILGLSTMISYKIFEDLPMRGLLEFFSAVLNVTQQQVVMMERNFLSQINYQTVISNQQYHKMLAMVLKEQKIH